MREHSRDRSRLEDILNLFQWSRIAKHKVTITDDIVIGRQEAEIINCIHVLRVLDNLLKDGFQTTITHPIVPQIRNHPITRRAYINLF